MLDWAEWVAGGTRVKLALPGGATHALFCRVEGAGPWLTLLHGFPTCSWDWAAISPTLATRYRTLSLDFLGYGDSDKPRPHRYSVFEQADLVEALWRQQGIGQTHLVAHDFGDSVATELLARQAEGRLGATITQTVLLNGGVYVDAYHPLLIQTLLRRPVIGPLIARLVTERRFARSLRAIFSPAHPISDADLRQHWQAIQRRDGARIYHALIRYIDERYAQRARWEGALARCPTPLHAIWGMVDPVSGADVAARLGERAPGVDLLTLPDVGHYPQIEVPGVVAAAIVRMLDVPPAR
ncbi:MAG TPA: alpha/beta hydrolase [Ktedonobacterales bacterium]|nr:alpha/beta hydrolase [Ktedonobacterales bacterium]